LCERIQKSNRSNQVSNQFVFEEVEERVCCAQHSELRLMIKKLQQWCNDVIRYEMNCVVSTGENV